MNTSLLWNVFPSIMRGTFRFILKVIDIVELSSIADNATWLVRVASGSDDITTYLVDSLCNGIWVVLPTVPYASSWLITKTSLEVSSRLTFLPSESSEVPTQMGVLYADLMVYWHFYQFGSLLTRLNVDMLLCSCQLRFWKLHIHFLSSIGYF